MQIHARRIKSAVLSAGAARHFTIGRSDVNGTQIAPDLLSPVHYPSGQDPNRIAKASQPVVVSTIVQRPRWSQTKETPRVRSLFPVPGYSRRGRARTTGPPIRPPVARFSYTRSYLVTSALVQKAHRLAPIGIVLRHSGHSLVVGSGGASPRRRRARSAFMGSTTKK